jgi:preprotein translocase subunit SecG
VQLASDIAEVRNVRDIQAYGFVNSLSRTMRALSAIFMAVALLLNPILEGVAPAHEIVGSWGGYGELPPLW